MSTLAEIEAQIAELEEANENLHDSLDSAESMDDAEAIEFLEVWKSVTRRLKPGRRRSSRTWNRSPSWKADRGAVCGDSKRWSGFHDRSATELQRLSAVAAK